MASHSSHRSLQVAILLAVSTQLIQTQLAVPVLDSVCDEENTSCFFGACSNCLAVYSRPEANSTYVNVALRGDRSDSGWIGLGLSKSGNMPDSSVMACIKNGDAVTVKNYYNNGYSSAPASDEDIGLSALTHTFVEGTLHCLFRRDIDIGAPNDVTVFPLDRTYTLLLGQGPLDGAGAVAYHSATPVRSSSPTDIRSGAEIGTASDALKKAHACLMVTAWVLCASVGIMMARFYKKDWAEESLCKGKVWFAIHRGCMVSTLVLTAVSFILIFVDRKGYSDIGSSVEGYKQAHPPLGIAVTILVVINPIMALVRPHPDTKYRPIFNWAHWGVGTSAHVLAVITVFFGMTLGGAQTFAPVELRYVMGVFVAVHVLTVIILEVVKCRTDAASERQTEMRTFGLQLEEPQYRKPSCSRTRAVVIYVYLAATVALWLAMILLMCV